MKQQLIIKFDPYFFQENRSVVLSKQLDITEIEKAIKNATKSLEVSCVVIL